MTSIPTLIDAAGQAPVPATPELKPPHVWTWLDPWASDENKTILARQGLLGLYRRSVWPDLDNGCTGVIVRLIDAPGYMQLPHKWPDLLRLLELTAPLQTIAYHRLPKHHEVGALCAEWSDKGGYSILDDSAGEGSTGPCQAQAIRDTIVGLEVDSPLPRVNGTEGWPEEPDSTDGEIGSVLFARSGMDEEPWPAYKRTKLWRPPRGLMFCQCDQTFTDPVVELQNFFNECSIQGWEAVVPSGIISTYGIHVGPTAVDGSVG